MTSIALGIPTRNRAPMVCELLEQCLSQTVLANQVIISDNASSDDTAERLAKRSHPSLTVVRQAQNVGMVGNWNACLNAADTEWFVLISDDDLIDPDFVASVQKAVNQTPDADVVFMRARILNRITGDAYENRSPTTAHGHVEFFADLLRPWLEGRFEIAFAGVVLKTSRLREMGGFPNTLPFAADVATWLPLASAGRASLWSTATLTYVLHPNMSTQGFSPGLLIDDTLAVAAMVEQAVNGTNRLSHDEKRAFIAPLRRYVHTRFNSIMIMSARRHLSKTRLLRVWLQYASRIPRLGVGLLSVGAVLIPTRLMQGVGAPYRRWVARRSGQQS